MGIYTFQQLFYIYLFLAVILLAGIGLGFLLKLLKKRKQILSVLRFALYEVTLPSGDGPGKEDASFKDLISTMEQFYAGLASILEDTWLLKSSFALELALPSVGEETVFFIAVPRKKYRLFEKHLQGLYPHAKIEEKKEDYNIFNADGVSAGGFFTLAERPFLPIRTYQHLNSDPLEVIAGAFAKLKKEGEGAALQIIVSRGPKNFIKHPQSALMSVRKGIKLSGKTGFKEGLIDTATFLVTGKDATTKEESAPVIEEEVEKLLDEKASFPVFNVNIRLVSSAPSKEEADEILQELSSSFMQFTETRGNSFVFKKVESRNLNNFLYRFSFRVPDISKMIPLNSRELTSIYHLPSILTQVPKLKSLKSKDAPAPPGLPNKGLLLGENIYRGETVQIMISKDDRRRHLYVVGQTGTGKTTLLTNMIKQDIEAGEGLSVIDPHGDMIEEVLSYIPENRLDDVVYFDPSNTIRPMALNFLEYDPAYPEQKTFIVNELLEIFKKLYGDVPEALGPMFETYFRNATLLVMEDPASGNTLFEIERVMSDSEFRALKLSRSKNPVVNAFWKDIAQKAGGEAALANMVPYITSKFDTFLTNEFMRPVLLQEHSSFNFRELIDSGKIFLVNLPKGKIGETNASLFGLMIVGKILMASFSRINITEEKRRDFYLYLDEFQNITTPSISTILSEARKYHLNLTVAHQFIGQLSEPIRLAIVGNVGSIVAFRIGAEDAKFMERQFEPVFNARDLMNIENFNAYLKLLVAGQTLKPFNIKILPRSEGNETVAASLKELSAHKYGRPLAEIEAEINRRYPQT